MKAMVLAAGFGTRMMPFTALRAKPTIPFLNLPILAHILAFLGKNAVTEVTINLHHRPDSIISTVGDGGSFGMAVHYSREEKMILGTSGGLKQAEKNFGPETFLMVNGDIILDLEFKEALAFHRKSGALATMILKPQKEKPQFASVLLDEDSRIASIAGRPEWKGTRPVRSCFFTGIHILEPGIFQSIESGVYSDINRDVYPKLMEQGAPIMGYCAEGRWFEVGSLKRYLDSSFEALRAFRWEHISAYEREPGIFLGPGCRIAHDASLESPFVAGSGVSIGSGVKATGGVILGDGVEVGESTEIAHSIVWSGAKIGSRNVLSDVILGDGVWLPPQTRRGHIVVSRTAEPGGLVEAPLEQK